MIDYLIKSKKRVLCPIPNCKGFGDGSLIPLFKLWKHLAYRHLEDEIRDCAFKLGITSRPRTRDYREVLVTRIAFSVAESEKE